MRTLALVVPCFNEAARLDADAFAEFVEARSDVDLVFVDDGSTDATGARLVALQRRAPDRIGVVTLANNRGKAEAVRQGMLAAIDRGADVVGYWDADLSTPLEAIDDLLSQLDEPAEIVVGSRVQLLGRRIVRNPTRHYFGRVFATLASGVLGLPIYDTQCGAKLFVVTDELIGALDQPFGSRWVFDVELLKRLDLALAHRGGLRAVLREFPLHRWEDVAGSKVSWTDVPRALGDLGSIYLTYRGDGSR